MKIACRLESRRFRPILWVLLCFTLQACTQFSALLQSKPEQVKSLLQQNRFYPALDVIDATPKTDPSYAQLARLRGKVLSAIAHYERKQLKSAAKLTQQGHWKEALALLDEALAHIPASKPLAERRRETRRIIEQRLAEAKLALARLRAGSLPEETRILRDMQRYAFDKSVDAALENDQREVQQAHALLIAEANRLIARGQTRDAYQYASLAHQLKADKDSQRLLQRIEQSINSDKVNRLKQAIDGGNLLLAKRIAAHLDSKDAEVEKLIKILRQKLRVTVSRLSREGQNAYTKGQLNQAIKHWEKALQLAPDNNDIKNLLLRAKTFQNNYQRFKAD